MKKIINITINNSKNNKNKKIIKYVSKNIKIVKNTSKKFKKEIKNGKKI
jgi:hypothetical protein